MKTMMLDIAQLKEKIKKINREKIEAKIKLKFIEEQSIDIALISESHDRENKRLEDHIKLSTHTVISNFYQRPTKEKGG